jgi:hypothetical protein
MEAHLKSSRAHSALSWLYALVALISLLLPYAALTQGPDRSIGLLAKTLLFPMFFGGIFVIHHLVARGAKERTEWARIASRIIAAITCLAFPLGTIIGVYLFVNSSWRKPSEVIAVTNDPSSDSSFVMWERGTVPKSHKKFFLRSLALWTYIALFVLISVLASLDDESSARGTQIESAVDFVVSIVTVVGLILYALRVRQPRLIATWKIIAPLILAAEIVLLVLRWPELVARDPEFSAAENHALLAIGLTLAAALLIPAIIINFRFANGRHLTAASTISAG